MTSASTLLVPHEGIDPVRSHTAIGEARGRHERRPCAGGGRLTLEQQLDSVWEGLLATGASECPVCPGHLRESHGGGGACDRCGTHLS